MCAARPPAFSHGAAFLPPAECNVRVGSPLNRTSLFSVSTRAGGSGPLSRDQGGRVQRRHCPDARYTTSVPAFVARSCFLVVVCCVSVSCVCGAIAVHAMSRLGFADPARTAPICSRLLHCFLPDSPASANAHGPSPLPLSHSFAAALTRIEQYTDVALDLENTLREKARS